MFRFLQSFLQREKPVAVLEEPRVREATPEEAARVRLEHAQSRLAHAKLALDKFRAAHCAVIDGQLCVVGDSLLSREQFDAEARRLTGDVIQAHNEFQARLQEWARHK